jgi:anaerobic selenocysteine-containing dehydrogenase
MGFEDRCFRDSDDEMIDTALASDNPWLAGIDRSRLESEDHIRLNFGGNSPASGFDPRLTGQNPADPMEPFLPFAKGNFPTSSGKAELYSESLKAQGLDPVVQFTPPAESRHSPGVKAFPLELLARKADNFLNSSFSNLPTIQSMEQVGLLEMNAVDARSRGIAGGDTVRVFNRRGEMFLTAKVNGAVQPGVLGAKLYWAKLTAQQQNINVLTSEKLSDMGNSATFYSVLVEVELSKPAV